MFNPGEIAWLIGLLGIFPLVAIVLSYFLVKYGLASILRPIMGRFSVFVADRYLFSRQHRGAINIITFISVLGVTYVCLVLIVILSVFNGFQTLIEGMYTAFDPDIKIVAERGKTLPYSDSLITRIAQTEGVNFVSPTIQDKAMLTYFDKQYLVEIKGVRRDYLNVSRLDTLVYEGDYQFETADGYPMTVLGGSVAYYINSRMSDRINPMKIWAIGDVKQLLRNPEAAMRPPVDIFTAGYFKVQMEYDTKYALVDYNLAEETFDMVGKVSSYDVKLNDFDDSELIARQLRERLGPDYQVQTWYDQHETLFNVMKNEKLVAYLILTLVLIIAGVNIIGGLSMIVLEKTRDIAILRSMGAQRSVIRRLFLVESTFVGGIGCFAGMLAAFVFSQVHLAVGVIRINGGESFAEIEYFPLEMAWQDYALTFVTVFALSILAGLYPSAKAAATQIVRSLRK
ncbi:MAG: ABC transporter permease [Bacteroidota bacterium]